MNDEVLYNVTAEEYTATVKREKALMRDYVLIETGKTPHENFNIRLLPKIPKEIEEKYYLTMDLMRLITGLDSTNLNLVESYGLWEAQNCEATNPFSTFLFNRIWKLNTYVIHDIKYFIDMMIGLTWWISQKDLETKIKVSSIGDYLNEANKDFTFFEEYRDYFQLINDIENANKHSIPNVQNNCIAADEPAVFALYSPHNMNIDNPKFLGITLKDLIRNFNKFYYFSLANIAELCQRKASE